MITKVNENYILTKTLILSGIQCEKKLWYDKNDKIKVEATKKVNKEYSKNKINNDFLFKSLMNDDFYHEINELMLHFDNKLGPLTKHEKCGFNVDEVNHSLEFHSYSGDNFPIKYRYFSESNEIFVMVPGNDNRLDKSFSLKQSREAEKYFLKQMTKHMEAKIR